MATLYRTDNTQEEINPKNGKNFTRKELCELIGCDMIEVIYLNNEAYHEGDPEGMIMIGDEEARLVGEPELNRQATRIYQHSWYPCAADIVGNVVICQSMMLK